MEQYLNLSGKSGIEAYEIGEAYVSVKFKEPPKIYTYSESRAGKNNVDKMKGLAIAGKGLSSYIKKNVRDLYDR